MQIVFSKDQNNYLFMKKLLAIVVLGLLWCNVGVANDKCIKLIDYDTLTFFKTDTFDRVSWKVEFENLCNKDVYVTFDFKFMTSDDFLLEKRSGYNVRIAPNTKKVIFDKVILVREIADRFKKKSVEYSWE